MSFCERNRKMCFKLWICFILGIVGFGFSYPALSCPSAFTKSKARKTFVSKQTFIRDIVKERKIISEKKWVQARNENPELKNHYPYQPQKTYSHFKWPGYGVRIKKADMVSKETFIKDIIEEKGIRSQNQWLKARKKNPKLKTHYPSLPGEIYLNFRWPKHQVRIKKADMVSKEAFIKDIVEKKEIRSQTQWAEARKETPELKKHYPYWPETTYSDFKWPDHRIWLKKTDMVSEENFIKDIVEERKIISQVEWTQAREETPELKKHYPSNPAKVYSHFKWPGYRTRLKKIDMVSKETFIKDIVEEKEIRSQTQWMKKREENPELNKYYPYQPETTYLNFKWPDYRIKIKKADIVSKETFIKDIVEKRKIYAQQKWEQARKKTPELKKYYPYWPEKIYPHFKWPGMRKMARKKPSIKNN